MRIKDEPGLAAKLEQMEAHEAESAATIDENQEAPNPQPERLTLRVRDQTGFEMTVRTFDTKPLGFVFNKYAKQACRDPDKIRFFLEGDRVNKDQTGKEVSHSTSGTHNRANW